MLRVTFRFYLAVGFLVALGGCAGPTAEEHLAAARAAMSDGELRTAEIHLKNVLQQRSDSATARVLLGMVYLQSANPRAAEQTFEQALALGANAAAVHAPLLQALLDQGLHREVLEAVSNGPSLRGPAASDALIATGKAHAALGDSASAEEAFRNALAITPDSLAARTEMASVYAGTGRIAAARSLLTEILTEAPDHVPGLLLLGTLDFAGKDYASARAAFQQVVELEDVESPRSRHFFALRRVAESLLAEGDYAGAEAYLRRLRESGATDADTTYLQAVVDVQRGNLDSAESRLEGLLVWAPEYWPAYRVLGSINANQGQLGQATMYLQSAVNNNPTDRVARLMLADMYARDDKMDLARQLFDEEAPGAVSGSLLALAGRLSLDAGEPEAAGRYFDRLESSPLSDVQELAEVSRIVVDAGEYGRAIRMLEAASFEVDEAEALRAYLLGLVQLRQGNIDAADEIAQGLVERYPEAAWPLNLEGTVALMSGRTDDARAIFARALEFDPGSVPVLLSAARAAQVAGDESQTIELLERVVDVDPARADVSLSLAQAALSRNDPSAAEAWLEQVPESPQRARMAGEINLSRGRFEAAAASFASAFEMAPDIDLAVRAYAAGRRAGLADPTGPLVRWLEQHPDDVRANAVLAEHAMSIGEPDRAIGLYESVLAASPLHVEALNNLAWLILDRDATRAIELATRALEADPDNPAVADTLGWFHVRQGEPARGLPALERAAAALPSNAEVRFHLAVALAETGDRTRAANELRAILARSENFPSRAEAERYLAELRGGDG